MNHTINKLHIVSIIILIISICVSGFSDQSANYFIKVPEKMTFIDDTTTTMGAKEGDLNAQSNAKPQHSVNVKAFYIDLYEVTNGNYAECVASGKCTEPTDTSSATRSSYYGNSAYDRYPVVNVTWQQASDYCSYEEKRLPTEAEWELAATGNSDYRRYSWGNTSPKSYYINITNIPGDTEMGNSYPKGDSPYGVADMTGNVSEWVSDWYDKDYYSNSPTDNPSGPENGTLKVVRGDSFASSLSAVHITNRNGADPNSFSNTTGFRCAKDVRERVYYNQPTEDAATAQLKSTKKAVVNSGDPNGIFILLNPGGQDLTLVCVAPDGSTLDILDGPKEVNYAEWYKVETSDGKTGWTIGTGIKMLQ